MQSTIFSPISSMIAVESVSLRSWLESLIKGHMSVGVLVNCGFCNNLSRLTTHAEKLLNEKISV